MMKRAFFGACVAGVLGLLTSQTALAVEAQLSGLNLRPVEGPIPTVSVAGAEDRARRYAQTIREALDFFETELGWTLEFRLAVLDRAAWERVSGVPWPAPFVHADEAYIVMPASIVDYPGFGQWNFEDRALTEVLTVHEVGHALGNANGLHSDNHWLHELIADLFLAAFIHARQPSMLPLLNGPPQGFGPFPHRQFADLDYLYSGVGLLNYAWYQFELARLANLMLAEKPFRQIALELVRQLDGRTPSLAPRSIEPILAVTPKLGGELARFTGESSLPMVQPKVCADAILKHDGDSSGIVFENSSSETIHVIDWVSHANRQGTADAIADLRGQPREAIPAQPATIDPGEFLPLFGYSGQELDIGSGLCVTVGEAIARYRRQ